MGTRRRPKGGADGEGVKLLYLAGQFSAPAGDSDPLHTVRANILAASRIALEAARAGWMPVCPHKNSSGFEHTEIPASFWYEGDIALMLRCDAVLMLPGWRASKGAIAEHEAATAAGMGVYDYEAFNEVPDPHESYWSGPVDRASTRGLVEELWGRDGVVGMLLGDEDVVSVTEDGSDIFTLSPLGTSAVALVVSAEAYCSRQEETS